MVSLGAFWGSSTRAALNRVDFMANRATARDVGNTVKACANTLWKRTQDCNVTCNVRNCRRLRGWYRVTRRPRMKTYASLRTVNYPDAQPLGPAWRLTTGKGAEGRWRRAVGVNAPGHVTCRRPAEGRWRAAHGRSGSAEGAGEPKGAERRRRSRPCRHAVVRP